ncbi:MAG: lipoyl(octanoyl) transferase, partial [Flammeovirgaceae bacterium]|nr:lipoyl(octanoyl) transferase [Flammeovirgaceae bacterium]
MRNRTTFFQHLGIMPYANAWDYQTQLFNNILAQKLENRQREENGLAPIPTPNYLLFVQHPHVYTMGKMGDEKHLLLTLDELARRGIEYFHTNRGGDITYHGYGQIVGYPILDLDNFFTDIHRYLRTIEEIVIRTLADYGIS